jgi:hypothetical protein
MHSDGSIEGSGHLSDSARLERIEAVVQRLLIAQGSELCSLIALLTTEDRLTVNASDITDAVTKMANQLENHKKLLLRLYPELMSTKQ